MRFWAFLCLLSNLSRGNDLDHDPPGQRVAVGILNYLAVLRELTEVRDRATLHRRVPILCAGFSTVDVAGSALHFFTLHGYAATIPVMLDFLRAYGLDQLVDLDAIDYYPREKTIAARDSQLQNKAVSECRAPGPRAWKTVLGNGMKTAAQRVPVADTGHWAVNGTLLRQRTLVASRWSGHNRFREN